ncbi:MAG: flagellar hook assembly protein FlgD [Alphaproteobacteria bacterium]
MEINGVGFKDPSSDGGTQAASSTLAGTFDTFLTLLTTQLQNQDPLDPMKSEQFTSQLVQFAGVEQSINTNKKLEQLIELQTASQLNTAVSYIGKVVEVVTDELMLDNGAAKISYGLDHNAATTIITIVDLNGNAVRTIDGEIAVGRHELTWDGRDASGNQVPDGVYGFSVVAVDDNDQTVDTVAASLGRVTGVEIVDGALRLNIGEMGVPFDSLFAVREDEPQS